MAEADPAQPGEGHDLAHFARNLREHLPVPAVEENRLLTVDEEVIEHEPGAAGALWQEDRYTIDALGDLIGSDIHRG